MAAGMHKLTLLAMLFACGAPPAGSAVEDDLTAVRPGLFRLMGAPSAPGDLVYLQLDPSGRFAWTRFTHGDSVREDGTWDQRGKSLRFFQQGKKGDPAPHFAFAYAVVSSGGARLWLRAGTGALPFALEKVAEADLCKESGGAWSGAACDCGKGWPTAYSAGAGGCWQSPPVTEEACDATQGSWTDDDTDLAGTYCECGIGRRLTATGCVDGA
jgi:hypothetical protein